MDSRKRRAVQAVSALLHNANLPGFFTGKLYRGALKSVCVPGLNCYSCPGAVGACPIGSLQSFLGGLKFRFPYYVVGLLIFFGALLGRAVCGFLCPFGFLQDLLYRLPFYKAKPFRLDRPLRYTKYAVLLLLVIVGPLCVALTPFFCQYVCPAGTLAGVLLALRDGLLRARLGGLFLWKCGVAVGILLACLAVSRAFCRYLCPLGAVYGLFNRYALVRLRLSESRCVGCGACRSECPLWVDPSKPPDSAECIRCGACVSRCPTGALHLGVRQKTEDAV